MPRSVNREFGPMEVKRVEGARSASPAAIKKLDDIELVMAKAHFGAAVERAIGDAPVKAFGDEGRLSRVMSGKDVPDYLARIYLDPGARRRLALMLVQGDDAVEVRTVVTFKAS